jgi:hypothetical protein
VKPKNRPGNCLRVNLNFKANSIWISDFTKIVGKYRFRTQDFIEKMTSNLYLGINTREKINRMICKGGKISEGVLIFISSSNTYFGIWRSKSILFHLKKLLLNF